MKSHLASMKKHGNVGVYPIETGIHSNSFYNEVKADFDGVLELKLEEMDGELRRFMRVYRYRGSHETKWYRLLIGPDRGVKIYCSVRSRRLIVISTIPSVMVTYSQKEGTICLNWLYRLARYSDGGGVDGDQGLSLPS